MRISEKSRIIFQSTPPCAGGDYAELKLMEKAGISIHAPLCGGRLRVTVDIINNTVFQSTPPCAGGDITPFP